MLSLVAKDSLAITCGEKRSTLISNMSPMTEYHPEIRLHLVNFIKMSAWSSNML